MTTSPRRRPRRVLEPDVMSPSATTLLASSDLEDRDRSTSETVNEMTCPSLSNITSKDDWLCSRATTILPSAPPKTTNEKQLSSPGSTALAQMCFPECHDIV